MPPKLTFQQYPNLPPRTNLNGAWRLEIHRSDSIRGYLGAMNCSEMAIEAMEKAEKEVETVHIITLTPQAYTIAKKSRVNNFKETYRLNQRVVTTIAITKDGMSTKEKTTYVTTDEGFTTIRIKSTMPTTNGIAEVSDTRRLENGLLYQELVLTNLSTGASNLTKRWWHPIPTPVEPEPEPDILMGAMLEAS
ncbi:hypothetical protein TrVE_jg7868 [Triparma verrucosa]|uniref:Uncharacterized protein n=2 Tax=Triparma TaxID=722752 RepID=A0A9W7AB08_9STRA|nr:hypothetical protein TrST_g10719 [Triparma strigata]GMH86369.1 hypothetical protein TrVE_jg7868 [Triparma verrucosa]